MTTYTQLSDAELSQKMRANLDDRTRLKEWMDRFKAWTSRESLDALDRIDNDCELIQAELDDRVRARAGL